MPGASEQTRRVKVLNANWTAGADGDDGHFELMIVTDDDHQHTLTPSPATMTALVALTQADDTVLLWDPTNRTLIVANLIGKWLEVDPASSEVRRST
jgi:hypothetical protein